MLPGGERGIGGWGVVTRNETRLGRLDFRILREWIGTEIMIEADVLAKDDDDVLDWCLGRWRLRPIITGDTRHRCSGGKNGARGKNGEFCFPRSDKFG
jgi:hypothetical protein